MKNYEPRIKITVSESGVIATEYIAVTGRSYSPRGSKSGERSYSNIKRTERDTRSIRNMYPSATNTCKKKALFD